MKKTMTILKLVLIVAALLGMPMMSAAQTVAPWLTWSGRQAKL